MRDNNCIFCKLANGDIPTNSIYEDDDFKIILDAEPATKGHALILPKQHFDNLLAADDDVLKAALPLAKKTANIMKEWLGCAGVNIVQNNGEAAGQTVNHLHIHVIPRYVDDPDKAILGWSHQSFSEEETKKTAELLNF